MDTPETKSAPERIARKIVLECADCDFCRLQFNQLLPTKVLHPVEILWMAHGRQ